ncbi:MAG: hypothetical protein IJW30_00985 [Clostridia bacterium]|nr:hypothetical protein [Clostridia bacterium]
MPFIDTKLNFRLSEEKEAILKARLADAITIFPGKSEYWLMLNFTDDARMWFRGYNNFPIAFVQIQLVGTASDEACTEMTKTVCKIFKEELNISPEHIYVKYEFVDVWGWNNENF